MFVTKLICDRCGDVIDIKEPHFGINGTIYVWFGSAENPDDLEYRGERLDYCKKCSRDLIKFIFTEKTAKEHLERFGGQNEKS